MEDTNNYKSNFLRPINSYRGKFAPEELAFNNNLQEFAQEISYICNLETNGKLSSEEAYSRIKNLWHQLKKSKKNLLDPS